MQQQAGCIIGTDYPMPMVNHEVVSPENMNRMKLAYAAHAGGSKDIPEQAGKRSNASDELSEAEETDRKPSSKRSKK